MRRNITPILINITMKKETILGIFLAIMTIWAIGFTAPKLYEIYKDKNFQIEEKTDTVLMTDTLYLESKATDTAPTTKYVTITEHDTVYKVVGDSIVETPRLIVCKKKLYQVPLVWRGRTLWNIQQR